MTPRIPRAERLEVFGSPNPKDCAERGLVLRAKGIGYRVQQRGALHSIWVKFEDFETAVAELRSYESENANWPPAPEAPLPNAPYALQGSAVYGALLVLVYFFDRGHAGGFDWTRQGVAHAESILGGEPWRALTALFLHGDAPHILSNLIFGLFFGYLVAIGHGGGLGWFAILLAGTLGNWANALIQDPAHLSLGASTAVFGALGVLAGSEWRRRLLLRQNGLRRAAPLVLALTAFAMHGVPQEVGNVDVGAHATGLLAGLLLGTGLPFLISRGLGSQKAQWCWGLASLFFIAGAWILALVPR